MDFLTYKNWRDFKLCELYNLNNGCHVMRINPFVNNFFIVKNYNHYGLFAMEILVDPLPKNTSGIAELETHEYRSIFLQTLDNLVRNKDIRNILQRVLNHLSALEQL